MAFRKQRMGRKKYVILQKIISHILIIKMLNY